MTLYDVNKAAYKALPAKTNEELDLLEKKLSEYLRTHLSKYYMMLCNELKYYTIYTWDSRGDFYKNTNKMAWEIIDVAKTLGAIKGIEFLDDGAVELWIEADDDCNLYYLFDYERGVIEV